MKLAIVNITAGGISGGYRKYLINLLPRLSSNPSVEKILCSLPSAITLNVIADRCSNIEFIKTDPFKIVNSRNNRKNILTLDKFQPNVVYVPVERQFYYDKAPVVNMLQNMEPFIWPFSGNPLIEKIKNLFRITTARNALKHSDRVIAISNFVKDYLTEQLNIDQRKIGLVYHGIDKPSNDSKKPVSFPVGCKDFLFTAGSIRPARGLDDIILALKVLKTEKSMDLVIAGHVDPGMVPYVNRLMKIAVNSEISKKIHWLGKLNDQEMSWCYKNCSVFVMTSRVEACPNIVLEAMAYGCISVSTESPPMPEFFANSAFYYPPKDFTILARQIKTALSMGESEKTAMSRTAKAIASRFSWEICAQKTVDELQKATGRSS